MGSPQPPWSVPNCAVKRLSLDKLPVDVLLCILENCKTLANLESLCEALPGLNNQAVFSHYQLGLRESVARNEFGPLEEVIAAIKVLELLEKSAASASVGNISLGRLDALPGPSSRRPIWSFCSTLANAVSYQALIPALREMNDASEKLSALYGRRVGTSQLNFRETARFKIALYRNVMFFSLFEEDCNDLIASGHGDWNSSDDDEGTILKFLVEDARHSKYRARNSYLSNFTHQEILEMDCVREFLCEIGDRILGHIQTLCDGFEMDGNEQDCIHAVFVEAHRTGGAESNCLFCDNDKFAQALIKRGPIFLVRVLEEFISFNLNAQALSFEDFLHGNLKEVKVEDLRGLSKQLSFKENDIVDEVMAFWASKKKEYQHGEEGERKTSSSAFRRKSLPKGANSIMDVMSLKFYERAIMDDGFIFTNNYNAQLNENSNDNNSQAHSGQKFSHFQLATPDTTRPNTPTISDRNLAFGISKDKFRLNFSSYASFG